MPLPYSVELHIKDGQSSLYSCTTVYSDTIFLIVNEIKSFGTMITVDTVPKLDDGVDYAIQTVLGSHSDDMITSIMESAAKKLAMEINKSMPHGLVCAFGLREVTFERMKSIIAALIETRPWLGASISSAPPSDKSATNAETQDETELDIADVNDTAAFIPLETMIKMFETAARTGDFSSLGGIPELQNRFHSQMSKNNAIAAETAIPQTVQTNSLPSEPSPAPPIS